MSALHPGTHLTAKQTQALDLPGAWSVWSKASDRPGAYFVIPADDTARDTGVKYAVVHAQMGRAAAEPCLELLRTDPYNPDLMQHTTNQKGARR